MTSRRRIARSRAGTLALAAALEAPAAALRRDLDGAWRVRGRHGHSSPAPTGGYQCHVYSSSRWRACMRAMRLMRIARAGTVEGVFELARLPGPVKDTLVRAVLGVATENVLGVNLRSRMTLTTKGERK
jgi:hypothetical protein